MREFIPLQNGVGTAGSTGQDKGTNNQWCASIIKHTHMYIIVVSFYVLFFCDSAVQRTPGRQTNYVVPGIIDFFPKFATGSNQSSCRHASISPNQGQQMIQRIIKHDPHCLATDIDDKKQSTIHVIQALEMIFLRLFKKTQPRLPPPLLQGLVTIEQEQWQDEDKHHLNLANPNAELNHLVTKLPLWVDARRAVVQLDSAANRSWIRSSGKADIHRIFHI